MEATPPSGVRLMETYKRMRANVPAKMSSRVLAMAKTQGHTNVRKIYNKFWFVRSMEYYAATKRNELPLSETKITPNCGPKQGGSMESRLPGRPDHKFLTRQVMPGSHTPGL